MTLPPLVLSALSADWGSDMDRPARISEKPTCVACRFCTAPLGTHGFVNRVSDGQRLSCALCHLVLHLDRPRIDDEARLIWLPAMSQAALNLVMRRIHLERRAAGQALSGDVHPTRDDPACYYLFYAESELRACGEGARARLDTDRPSELARALQRLTRHDHARRDRLLGDLRLLPSGRFYVGEEDVYPAIVDGWRHVTRSAPAGIA